MSNTNLVDVKALQAYVHDFSPELFSRFFTGFETASIVRKHMNLKGKKTWTQQEYNQLLKVWFPNYNPTETNQLKPVTLETHTFKWEHRETPQLLRETYLNEARQPGFNHQQWPFEAFTMMGLMAKGAEELEDAVWQGVKKATAFVEGDPISVLFDGYLKIIADAITATTITPVVTGAITEANILDNLKAMYSQLPVALKKRGTDIFMSVDNFDKYVEAFDERYKGNSAAYATVLSAGYTGMRYRQGAGKTTIIPVIGMGDSDRIIMLPREHFHIGFDLESDINTINVDQEKRHLDFWADSAIGVQITLLDDKTAVVNDQA